MLLALVLRAYIHRESPRSWCTCLISYHRPGPTRTKTVRKAPVDAKTRNKSISTESVYATLVYAMRGKTHDRTDNIHPVRGKHRRKHVPSAVKLRAR